MFDESPRESLQSTDGISPEISLASDNGIIEIAQAPSAGGETIGHSHRSHERQWCRFVFIL